MDGSPLEDLKVDGLFTYGGFNSFFMDQLSSVAERLSAESWVLGEAGTKAGVEAQLSTLGKSCWTSTASTSFLNGSTCWTR